jgi:hypothetical protein
VLFFRRSLCSVSTILLSTTCAPTAYCCYPPVPSPFAQTCVGFNPFTPPSSLLPSCVAGRATSNVTSSTAG